MQCIVYVFVRTQNYALPIPFPQAYIAAREWTERLCGPPR